MAHCRHTHHSHEKKADAWTKIGAAGEAAASFISDAYWLGGLIDLAAQLDDVGVGLSWYGLGFGSALSLLLTVGSVYSHTIVNINHQDKNHATDCEHHHEEPTKSNVNEDEDKHIQQKLLTGKGETKPTLSIPQKLALVSDFVSHTGDIAGPITFIANIASQSALPVWGKALVQCGATLFGGVSSVAGVRTCKNSMLKANKEKMEKEQREEKKLIKSYGAIV